MATYQKHDEVVYQSTDYLVRRDMSTRNKEEYKIKIATPTEGKPSVVIVDVSELTPKA